MTIIGLVTDKDSMQLTHLGELTPLSELTLARGPPLEEKEFDQTPTYDPTVGQNDALPMDPVETPVEKWP
jgi:hypothetical protein